LQTAQNFNQSKILAALYLSLIK